MPFIVILTMKDTFIEKLSPCQHLVKASPSSYVLGCLAMYHYFSADWGKTAALCLLAAVLFLTSLILYGISWLLKPKKNFPGDIMQSLGKSFDLIHQANILKNMFSGVFSKVLGSVLLMIMFIIWEKRHQRNNK